MSKKINPTALVLIIYGLCFACRLLEYCFLRTGQTPWGEFFAHKLASLVILLLALKYCGKHLDDIGFTHANIGRRLFNGLALGLLVFIPAYLAEIAILTVQGRAPALKIFVSAYDEAGGAVQQTTLLFFLVCIAGCLITVLMEEGLFRGLFQKLLDSRFYFISAAAFSATLFGFWHIAEPIRSYYDGDIGLANMLLLTVTSGLAGFKFALLTRLTNSLYMAIGHHFADNAAVHLLHVVSSTGADELMLVRISVAQALSFLIVIIWYILHQRKTSIRNSIMYV